MRYLLDANILSALMRERPDARIEDEFRSKRKSCVIAAPVLYELAHGVAILPEGARKQALAEGLGVLTKGMTVLSFDREAARWLASENARLRGEGRPTGMLDGQIAAVVATRGCILVTRNIRDFEGYRGLHIETWSD